MYCIKKTILTKPYIKSLPEMYDIKENRDEYRNQIFMQLLKISIVMDSS